MLPLGSVVRLFGSNEDAKLMIIGRLVIQNENGVEGYYDYVACPHAIGATIQRFFYFNEEDVQEIYFKGYIDDIELKLNTIHQKTMEETKLPKLKTKK